MADAVRSRCCRRYCDRSFYAAWALLTVATTGQCACSALNWLLGRSIERLPRKSAGFRSAKAELETGTAGLFIRFGRWSLLLSWVDHLATILRWSPAVIARNLSGSFLLIVTLPTVPATCCLASVLDAGWVASETALRPIVKQKKRRLRPLKHLLFEEQMLQEMKHGNNQCWSQVSKTN